MSQSNDDPPRPSSPSNQTRIEAERAIVFERALASVSHAAGTPLQVIGGRASMIRSESKDPDLVRHATIIERKVRELSDLLKQLNDFAREPEPEVTVHLVQHLRSALSTLALAGGCSISVEGSDDATVTSSPDLLAVGVRALAEEIAADCPPNTQVASRVSKAEGTVLWSLPLPESFPLPAWTHVNHETWMEALHQPHFEKSRVIRKGIALGCLKRLGANYTVHDRNFVVSFPSDGC